ncbi:MAG: hypothetical protein EHM28_15205, partial [Spirochaetaceae bacterium]
MKENIFVRNALRIKIQIVVIMITVGLAVYKTMLGSYLIGFSSTEDALYQNLGKISLVVSSLVGFTIFYLFMKPFHDWYNLARKGLPVPDSLYRKAKNISRRVQIITFLMNGLLFSLS